MPERKRNFVGVYKKFKGRSVFLKLFGSYLLILALTLAVELGISVGILNTSREQAETLNKSLMQLVKNECDNQIKNIYRNLDLLALDDRVQLLSNVRGEFRPNNQYVAYSLYDELQRLRLSSEEYNLLYVYFKNSDSVISFAGNMSLEMYHSLYYKNLDISLEELREYLCRKHYHDINVISSSDTGPGEIMYTMTSLKTDVGETTATIVIQVTSDSIDNKICSAKWNEAIQVAVLNSKNEVLNSIDLSENIGSLRYEKLPVNENFSINLEEGDYMGIAMESEAADWIYVLLTPKYIIENGARQMEKYCLIGLGICLAAGFFSAYYLSRKNYSPVKGLVELFRNEDENWEYDGAGQSGNEYQWLESQAKSFFRKHEDVRRSLNKNQKHLRDFCLYKLLAQPYEELEDSERELLNRSGITDGILRVVFLSVGIPPGETEQEETVEKDLKRFIIKNVAGETLNEVFHTEMLETGNYVIALVRLEAMNKDNYDRMWNALSKAFDLIKKEFHFYMQICAGTAKEGLDKVHFSYLEAKETQEYAVLLETYFINYNDIKNRSKKYYYPAEADARIMNAISAGKPEPAILCVKEILGTNYQKNHITAKLLPCLIYDLLGTLMRSADEIGCSDFFEQYWTESAGFEGLAQKAPEEVAEQFEKLIYALCREVEKVKAGDDTNLADKIQKYILENYQNPDLNISQAALYFEKTPAYISAVYKKQTGKSLLKFITQTRIERAIILLEEGKSVNETAVLSGFRDSRSFIRVFKVHTGLTPGQMKRE